MITRFVNMHFEIFSIQLFRASGEAYACRGLPNALLAHCQL